MKHHFCVSLYDGESGKKNSTFGNYTKRIIVAHTDGEYEGWNETDETQPVARHAAQDHHAQRGHQVVLGRVFHHDCFHHLRC